MSAARLEDLVPTSIPPIPSGLISGVDLGYSDASRCATASSAPPAADRFELPF